MTEEEEPERKAVEVLLPSGERVDGEFILWDEAPEQSDDVMIELRFLDRHFRATSDVGYFDALLAIRQELEPEGIFPLCYGVSRTVHPSEMSRSMGVGDMAYRLELGRRARQKD